MAYGRLDVFWPDGKFETFMLDADTVTLGRHSDNIIQLDTDTVSRYHFSVTRNPETEMVSIMDMDSANGTFVDGVQLDSNVPHVLEGVEEIQAGHLRILYHPVDDDPTVPMQAIGDETQRVERITQAFRIDVRGPEIAIPPGAHTSAELYITNTGEDEQRFTVTADGMPKAWVRINRPELSLAAGDTTPVLLNFKPARRSDSVPGDYTVTVRVAIKDQPDQTLEAPLLVRVLPYSGFGVALARKTILGGDPFALHVHNQGNNRLPVSISGRDKGNKLNFDIQPRQLTLEPGQHRKISGTVRPGTPFLVGTPREHEFHLIVKSHDAAGFTTAVEGRVQVTPMLPTWAAWAIGGVVVALIALVLLLLPSLLLPPTPIIDTFTVGTTQIIEGTPLPLAWTARNAESYTVRVNGVVLELGIPGDTTTYSLDTSGLQGSITVELVAVNGDANVLATSQPVRVYEAMRVDYFNVTPTRMLRYVVQTLSLEWSVPGAEYTRIAGLENFSNAQVEPTYSSTDAIENVSGIPTTTFTLSLYAEDALGNPQEAVQTIEVVDATCTATTTMELHFGPNVAHNVVGTVQAGTMVVVTGRDGSGQWLQIALAGGTQGWGLRDSGQVVCDTFNPDDLRVADLDIPAPPTAIPTPVPVISVSVLVDDTTEPFSQAGVGTTTVADVLIEMGVTLTPLDRVVPPPETLIADGMQIQVIRVTQTVECENEPVPFSTHSIIDPRLPAGTQQIARPGQPGIEEVCYDVVREDGQVASRVETSRTITQQPRPEFIRTGRAESDPSD